MNSVRIVSLYIAPFSEIQMQKFFAFQKELAIHKGLYLIYN